MISNLLFLFFYIGAGAVLLSLCCALEWVALRWHERKRMRQRSMRDWK